MREDFAMSIITVDEYEPIVDVADYPFDELKEVKIRRDIWVTDEYEVSEFLGRGKFGEVKKCREKYGGKEFAAKFLSVRTAQDEACVENEISIMKKLQHRRILQLYDAFSFGREMCLVLEIVLGGELFDRVIDDEFILTEKSCVCIIRQICEGVRYMHSRNILHLDLKPENILCLSKEGNRIKIIDFGLARVFDPAKDLRVLFGTPEFMAPEVVQYDAIGAATDMWSVGVISYVILSGLSPFMGDNDGETLINVTKVDYDFDYDEFGDVSEAAKDMIEKLLLLDKRKRLSAEDCLNHPWLKIPEKRPHELELSKERLKHYVYRRKWHKAVHAIIALRRMGCEFGAHEWRQRETIAPKRPLRTKINTNAATNAPREQKWNRTDRLPTFQKDTNRPYRAPEKTANYIANNSDTISAPTTISNKVAELPKSDSDQTTLHSSNAARKTQEDKNVPWLKTIHKSTPLSPLSSVMLQTKSAKAPEKDSDLATNNKDFVNTKAVVKDAVSGLKRAQNDVADLKSCLKGNRKSWQKLNNEGKVARARAGLTDLPEVKEDVGQSPPSATGTSPRDREKGGDSIVKQMQKRLQTPKMMWSRVGATNVKDGDVACETFKVREGLGRSEQTTKTAKEVSSGASHPAVPAVAEKTAPARNTKQQHLKETVSIKSKTTATKDTVPEVGRRRDMSTTAAKRALISSRLVGTSRPTAEPSPVEPLPVDETSTSKKPPVFKTSQRGLVRSHPARNRHSNHNPAASFKRRSTRAPKDINAESEETYVRLDNAPDVLQQQEVDRLSREEAEATPRANGATPRANEATPCANEATPRKTETTPRKTEATPSSPERTGRKAVNRIQATIKMLTSSKDDRSRAKKSPRQTDDNNQKNRSNDWKSNADVGNNIEFAMKESQLQKTNLNNHKKLSLDSNGNNRKVFQTKSS